MAAMKLEAPFYPIIYVRGYAGSEDAMEETVADPYMGFNLGATKLRQTHDKKAYRHYFESPLVRLMKDYQYVDVYTDGAEMPPGRPVPPRSVVILRYYDSGMEDDVIGRRREIEDYARDLDRLIARLRERISDDNGVDPADFRVYIVAHSMGGLVTRCFLQNPAIGSAASKKAVDKVFTYATPHNGIDVNFIGNVPGFFSANNANNFDRDRMMEYLALTAADGAPEQVDSLGDQFDASRFFCLVGTNHRDYGTARRAIGPMSDGLVRIENATVWGRVGKGAKARKVHAPRAFVHRSHSGHYGIVNSEEGYQNLRRFLFGDVRVDGKLQIKQITLPPAVQRALDAGDEVHASYHFETIVRVRGTTWDLHRRLVDENSAILRTFRELIPKTGEVRSPYLFSTFLSRGQIVDKPGGRRRSLGFSIDLGVRVPEYEVERTLRFDLHHEGGYLFRDKINLEALEQPDGTWKLRYGFDSKRPNQVSRQWIDPVVTDAGIEFRIPVVQKTRPGIDAELVLTAREWN